MGRAMDMKTKVKTKEKTKVKMGKWMLSKMDGDTTTAIK